jgi:carbamoyltransferase
MSIIVGLNAYHADSAACIVVDGTLVAAAEEERFRRVKHWAGFPSEAIAYCLREAGVRLADVDFVGLNSDRRANLLRKAAYSFKRRPDLGLMLERLRNAQRRARGGARVSWRGVSRTGGAGRTPPLAPGLVLSRVALR